MSNHPAQLHGQQPPQQQQKRRKRKAAHATSPTPGGVGKRMRSLAELLASADSSPAASGGQPIAPPPPQPQQGHALHSLHLRSDTDSSGQLWHGSGIDALVAAASAQQAASETPRTSGIPPASAIPVAPTLRTPDQQSMQLYNARQQPQRQHQQQRSQQQQWQQRSQQPVPLVATDATTNSSSSQQHLLEQAARALVLRHLVQHVRTLLLQSSAGGAAAAPQPTVTEVLVQALQTAVVQESGVEVALTLARLLLHHLRAPQLQPLSSWWEQVQVPHAMLHALLQRLQ